MNTDEISVSNLYVEFVSVFIIAFTGILHKVYFMDYIFFFYMFIHIM